MVAESDFILSVYWHLQTKSGTHTLAHGHVEQGVKWSGMFMSTGTCKTKNGTQTLVHIHVEQGLGWVGVWRDVNVPWLHEALKIIEAVQHNKYCTFIKSKVENQLEKIVSQKSMQWFHVALCHRT